MKLEQAIKYALDGDAVLFLGSGASLGAINIRDEEMISASELSQKIYPNCEDVQQAVDLFLTTKNEDNTIDKKSELISMLKDEFTCKSITKQQESIAEVPWKRIYTTNYDNMIELAYSKASKQILSVETTDNVKKKLSKKELICVHINGYIKHLDVETFNSSFKLSEVSYNTESFSNNAWKQLFIEDIRTYSTVIFVGFSMKYDLDIRRIISQANNKKLVFIVGDSEKENNIISLRKYGDVYNIGLNGFVDAFNKISKNYFPIKKRTLDNTHLTNFKIRNKEYSSFNKPNDRDVLSYYSFGKHIDDMYFKEKNSYYAIVKRTCLNNIVEDINSDIKAVFIHSDIGNGKTELIEQLCYELTSNYKIYELIDDNEKISDEIEMICSSNNRTIIIIENFYNYFDAFKKFQLFDTNNNITYIFTARTSIYKSRFESFEIEPISVYDLNRLDNSEISKLCKIFEEYGYYLSINEDNERNIKSKCKSRLQSILLSLFDSNQISKEFDSISDNILNAKYQHYKLVLFLIISKVMSLSISFNDALYLTEEYSVSYDFQKDINVNELFDWRDSAAEIKSVALCVWLLKHNDLVNDVFDVLVETAKIADRGYELSRKYENFLGNIISYKHLRFIIQLLNVNDVEKRKIINNFYERIKNLRYYNNKYYFWLQYAMSSIELKDYAAANMHLKAAYANLPDNMKPFEINNQYARLKMECMLLESYKYTNKTFSEICEIDRLLTPMDAKNDEKYYSFKMAYAYYRKLFSKFFKYMSNEERDSMRNIAKEKYNSCSKYMKNNYNIALKKSVEEFSVAFLYLSCFDIDDIVDFSLTVQKGKHLFGYFIRNNIKENAHIFISDTEMSFRCGNTYKASIIEYDDRYKKWQLSLLD